MLQEEVKLRFHLRITMYALCDDFFRACGFQFAHLTVEVLPAFFAKRAAGEAVVFAHAVAPSCKIKGQCGILHFSACGKPHFPRVLPCLAYDKENRCLVYAVHVPLTPCQPSVQFGVVCCGVHMGFGIHQPVIVILAYAARFPHTHDVEHTLVPLTLTGLIAPPGCNSRLCPLCLPPRR